MNATQRRILVRTLFVVAALSAALCLFVVVSGAPEALFRKILWATLLAPSSFVAALYLRAGGTNQ